MKHTYNLAARVAWWCGRMAVQDNMQRVVPPQYVKSAAAWLAGFDGKPMPQEAR